MPSPPEQWCRQRSSTTATTISHSDSFTYHMVSMELVGVLGSSLSCWGISNDNITVLVVGTLFLTTAWFGQMFFHILTCVERYLAVFHPITYLSLKKQRGIQIRNITNGCVWLLSFMVTLLFMLDNTTVDFRLLVLCFIIIFLCSLSVLCVLNRPGPGEQGGDRGRVDQSKQRAFYIIVIILGVLSLRCTWNLVWILLHFFRGSCECLLMMCDYWFNLPCSLVLPVLFLHRSEKLVC